MEELYTPLIATSQVSKYFAIGSHCILAYATWISIEPRVDVEGAFLRQRVPRLLTRAVELYIAISRTRAGAYRFYSV